MKRKVVSITLDPTDLDKVKQLAVREDRSVSFMINLFIRDALKKPEKLKRIIKHAPTGRYVQQ